MEDKFFEYYIKVKDVTEVDEFSQHFEMWINSDYNFLSTWERIFNDENFDFDSNNYIELKSWIDSNSLSLVEKNNELYIHPHILLAFSLNEPLVKINLISSLFSLPQDTVNNLLQEIYSIALDDDDEDDDVIPDINQ